MLAEAAILGLPVDRIIRSRDPEERALLREAMKVGAQLYDELQTALARKIVKEMADAQERGAKKSGKK